MHYFFPFWYALLFSILVFLHPVTFYYFINRFQLRGAVESPETGSPHSTLTRLTLLITSLVCIATKMNTILTCCTHLIVDPCPLKTWFYIMETTVAPQGAILEQAIEHLNWLTV